MKFRVYTVPKRLTVPVPYPKGHPRLTRELSRFWKLRGGDDAVTGPQRSASAAPGAPALLPLGPCRPALALTLVLPYRVPRWPPCAGVDPAARVSAAAETPRGGEACRALGGEL